MTVPRLPSLGALGFSSYNEYLRSPHWRRFRRLYRQSKPWVCCCGEREDLHLHHLTYERLGCERLSDVTPLCGRCHSMLHQLVDEGQATLDPSSLFMHERSEVYEGTRTDRKNPVGLQGMTTEEIKERNKLIRKGLLKPRDWRNERELPRKK